jgi:endonuclease V-like protein UPF0215 family
MERFSAILGSIMMILPAINALMSTQITLKGTDTTMTLSQIVA